MRSPRAAFLAIVFAAWAANAHAQYLDGPSPYPPGQPGADPYTPGPYGPPGVADGPAPPMFGVVPGPNLACQPVPALQQSQESVPLLDIRRFYTNVDYICWWFKDSYNPVLVTAGSISDPVPGALGQPGTVPLDGGKVDTKDHSGVLITTGYWFDSDLTFGLEGSYFLAGNHKATTVFSSSGEPGDVNLYRPFYNVNTGSEQALVIASTTGTDVAHTGSVIVGNSARLTGGELNFMACPHLLETDWFQLKVLAGFRVMALNEGLDIASYTSDRPIGTGADTSVIETFGTGNTFYGAQVGVDARFLGPGWYIDLRGKVAAGDNQEVVNINGGVLSLDQTTGAVTQGSSGVLPLPANTVGSLLTQPSNFGRYHCDYFAVVPEGTLTFGLQFTKGISATVAYNFLYMSQTVRPGNVVDRSVSLQPLNPSLPTGNPATAPVFAFHESEFWAQGLNVGLEIRY